MKVWTKREESQIKSNQMSLLNVRFAVKTTSVTPPSITGRYQCTTQADRDVGYRERFKTVPAIYHEINMNVIQISFLCLQMLTCFELLIDLLNEILSCSDFKLNLLINIYI